MMFMLQRLELNKRLELVELGNWVYNSKQQ